MSVHLSPYELDLHALGGLSADKAARIDGHLGECPDCRHLMQAAAERRDHFLRFVAPKGLRRAPRPRWPLMIGPILAVAALMLLVRPRTEPAIGVKGGPTLSTFVRHQGTVAPLASGQALHAGDELRFAVIPDRLPYLLVCSIDGAGHRSVYFPFDGTASGTVDPNARVELPGSVVLDDAPGPERVFALFSKKPISAADAVRALGTIGTGGAAIRAARVLSIGAEAQQTVLFEKAK